MLERTMLHICITMTVQATHSRKRHLSGEAVHSLYSLLPSVLTIPSLKHSLYRRNHPLLRYINERQQVERSIHSFLFLSVRCTCRYGILPFHCSLLERAALPYTLSSIHAINLYSPTSDKLLPCDCICTRLFTSMPTPASSLQFIQPFAKLRDPSVPYWNISYIFFYFVRARLAMHLLFALILSEGRGL